MAQETRIIVSVFFSPSELDFLAKEQKKNKWSSRSETIRELALKDLETK